MLPTGRSLSCKLPAMSCPESGQRSPTTGSIPALHGSAPPFCMSQSGARWTMQRSFAQGGAVARVSRHAWSMVATCTASPVSYRGLHLSCAGRHVGHGPL